jgi:hypothetical protein
VAFSCPKKAKLYKDKYNKTYYAANKDRLRARELARYKRLKKTKEGSLVIQFNTAATRKRKQDWLIKVKLESGCVDCRNKKLPHYVLEFDHCRGVKKFNLGSYGRLSWSKIEAEVAKCDVVCANCHKIRTWKRILSKTRRVIPIGRG